MFDAPYSFSNLGHNATIFKNPVKKHIYKFKTGTRVYLVIFEVFDFGYVAVKYCARKDYGSHNAFTKIFNDYDFKIITTCLFIMWDYWKMNPNVTFAFYAVLRNEILPEKVRNRNIEEYKKSRYNIYKYSMVNKFSHEFFTHIFDSKNCIYLLVNKKQRKPKTSFKSFTKYLKNNYDIVFTEG